MLKKKKGLALLGAIAILLGIALFIFVQALKPVRPGTPTQYLRVDQPTSLSSILAQLQERGQLRSAKASAFLARFSGARQVVSVGTYSIGGGLSGGKTVRNLMHPIRRMFRIPETNWSNRTARLLAKNQACEAAEYESLVQNPSAFQGDVKFPLPQTSLEGYLYPDT